MLNLYENLKFFWKLKNIRNILGYLLIKVINMKKYFYYREILHILYLLYLLLLEEYHHLMFYNMNLNVKEANILNGTKLVLM